MKILHVNASAHPVGGAETYMLRLIEAQTARGDAVALLHQDSGVNGPRSILQERSGDPASDLRWIASFKPDLVHIHDWSLPLDSEQVIQARYPVVRALPNYYFSSASGERWFRDGTVCLRAHGPVCLVNLVAKGCAHRLDLRPAVAHYRTINRRLPLVQASAACVVASEFVRSIAIANGVDRERCHVIPYFADRAPEPPAPSQTPDVAFVGRVSKNKGLDVLLEALAMSGSRWGRLFVVGEGWYQARCEQLAERLGIDNRVEFLGWRTPTDVAAVLRRVSVLVLPSRWPEPFGIVGIEAMAQARPVIASRIGGIPEWLDDGETGVLVPPGDASALARAISTLLADRRRAEEMGREGWRRVDRFGVQSHLRTLDDIYAMVMQKTSAAEAVAR